MANSFDQRAEAAVDDYITIHGYNAEKAKKMAVCYSEDSLYLLYYDPAKATKGLLEGPQSSMPVVIIAREAAGKITIEETENTAKYLV